MKVALDEAQLLRVQRAADFLADKVKSRRADLRRDDRLRQQRRQAARRASRARRAAGGNPETPDGTLLEELQHNLIVTHAVCVGKPFGADVVRAMLVIRINTLMRGHSGIRVSTLQALLELLNARHRAGHPGKRFGRRARRSRAVVAPRDRAARRRRSVLRGERMSGAQALERAGLQPVRCRTRKASRSTTARRRCSPCARARAAIGSESLLETADLAAAMTLDAFAGRGSAFPKKSTHCVRIRARSRPRATCASCSQDRRWSTFRYHLVPRFRTWLADIVERSPRIQQTALRYRLGLRAARRSGTAAKRFYRRFLPFKGGKKHQPQEAYCLRCIPQVHGAVRDALEQAYRVIDIELNAVTDNPLVFPDATDAKVIEDQVISAGHFHGMPLALAMSYVKAAIPVLASISERRLNKLVDPATSDGLPAFLIGNEDGDRFGLHDRAVHRCGARQRSRDARASGVRVFDSDQRERRRPRLDGRERSAPCARR